MRNKIIVLKNNLCVCCGKEIPEGSEICSLCKNDPVGILERLQENTDNLKNHVMMKKVLKD